MKRNRTLDVERDAEMIDRCVMQALLINRVTVPEDTEYFYGIYRNHYICEFTYTDYLKNITYACGIILDAKYKSSIDFVRIPIWSECIDIDEAQDKAFKARKNIYYCFDTCIQQKGIIR